MQTMHKHAVDDMPKYFPAGLTQYYTSKSPPYYVTEDEVSAHLERLVVDKIASEQLVRGRGGVSVVLYETHWIG